MLLTNHVLSGALIGALTRRPLLAFAAGVASHFVLDAVPHWGEWENTQRFLRAAVPDGLASLAVMGALAAASPADRRVAVVAGMSGAALPDLDKPIKLWFGRSPFPKAVDRFHSRIQREAAGRAHLELLAAGALAAAALAAIRRPPAGRCRRRMRSTPLSSGVAELARKAGPECVVVPFCICAAARTDKTRSYLCP